MKIHAVRESATSLLCIQKLQCTFENTVTCSSHISIVLYDTHVAGQEDKNKSVQIKNKQTNKQTIEMCNKLKIQK